MSEARISRVNCLVSFGLSLGCALAANGQAGFVEHFDNLGPFISGQVGPASLVNQGWIFRNQSQPAGGIYYTWRGGPYMFMGQYMTFAPQAGAGYLAADARSTETSPFNLGGAICDWAILPPVQNQQAGDVLTLWARRHAASSANDTLEIRYSPGGGTDTGSGPQGIGDFTVLLRSINPVPGSGWGMFDAELPGTGRLAIRYLSTACTVGCIQPYLGVDSLTVGPPAPPCPDFVQIPQAGQQVTWTAAGGPYAVCADVLIPPTSTVVVEPGTTVNIDGGRAIVVEGTLLAMGTQADPVTFSGPDETAEIRVFGTAEFDHTDINARIEPQDGGGSIILRDSVIHADQAGALSVFGQPTYLWNNPPFIALQRSTVQGDGSAYEFFLNIAHVLLDEVTFDGAGVLIMDSYVRFDQVIVDGKPIDLLFLNRDAHQEVYINHVTVQNYAGGPGLSCDGANLLLGPDNTLQNNAYAVGASGLLPGSVVPQSGNANDLVPTPLTVSGAVLADVGVPYVYDREDGCVVGWPTIEAGVTIKMAPDAAICNQGGYVLARGLPDAPIVFEPLLPGQRWNAFLIGVSFGSRFDNVVLDGGHFGLIVTNGGARLVDSRVCNNDIGANTNTYGILQVMKTQFQNNAVGVQTTDTSTMWLESPATPNSFDGNTLAAEPLEVLAEIDARFNWWGDPSGPQHPANPGGQGDAIGGAGVTHYQPFLNASPDFDNHPPAVRLKKNDVLPEYAAHALFESGSKFIVEWHAEDDDAIVEQRLLFSAAGDLDSAFELVAVLPAGQRAYEWTVPEVPFIASGASSYLRMVALDSTGQEGWDQIKMFIPSGDVDDQVEITSNFAGQTFRAGQTLPPLTWALTDGVSLDGQTTFFILLDGDEKSVYLGGGYVQEWLFTDSPFASTDTARLAIKVQSTNNHARWFFGDYFSLRPDSGLGDASPVVTLLSPASGSAYPGGGTVPISWLAEDDEALHGFKIQASYDGGRTWHVIARDLPGEATNWDWHLPASTGIADVRVRVVAMDRRFQNSSDGSNTVFAILPGDDDRPADLNDDGVVNSADLALLLGSWGPCTSCAAELNNDGTINAEDLALLLGSWD